MSESISNSIYFLILIYFSIIPNGAETCEVSCWTMVPTGWEVSSFKMRRSLRSIGQDADRREVSWPTVKCIRRADV
ncbi:MAG: hypothetical protein KBF75_07845 [Saprospiraceae bacterium]|nr:hypothetical protein [Saprospiraceae bacterium]HMT78238.1 hypothetical protein [Saprospiraceae bacterium]